MSNKTQITAVDGTTSIEVVREFEADRARVFAAYVDPELVQRWLGPRRLTMRIREWQARPGGAWSYLHSGECEAGQEVPEYGFRGVFHDIVDDERIVQTFEFERAPGHVSLEVARFEDAGPGRTKVFSRSVFETVEARDGMVAGGMSDGVSQSMDRLEELLAATAARA